MSVCFHFDVVTKWSESETSWWLMKSALLLLILPLDIFGGQCEFLHTQREKEGERWVERNTERERGEESESEK